MVARKCEYSILNVLYTRSIFRSKGKPLIIGFIANSFKAFTLSNAKRQLKVKGTTKRWKIKRTDMAHDGNEEKKNARTFACPEALISVTIKRKMSERLIKRFSASLHRNEIQESYNWLEFAIASSVEQSEKLLHNALHVISIKHDFVPPRKVCDGR